MFADERWQLHAGFSAANSPAAIAAVD